jgi:hypothetical protein
VQDKLQRIELERAEAEARAQERRRRRRIVLGLVASLLLLLGILGGGTIWTARREAARQRDQAARREQIQRQLAETLEGNRSRVGQKGRWLLFGKVCFDGRSEIIE